MGAYAGASMHPGMGAHAGGSRFSPGDWLRGAFAGASFASPGKPAGSPGARGTPRRPPPAARDQEAPAMSTVYLNGDYLPMSEARISPMDRGFLFGEGVYEVIPSHEGRMVGFKAHIERMRRGLRALRIGLERGDSHWLGICRELTERNGGGHLGIYLHVSRGADSKRFHAYPEHLEPTVFGFAFEAQAPQAAERAKVRPCSAGTAQDLRWKRCDIKSTALLANVMHFEQGYRSGNHETILYNASGELTEASSANIYVARGGTVATPPADRQILPGVTRQLLLAILRADGRIPVEERPVALEELRRADEVWLSSSTKGLLPVTAVDGAPVGDGMVGELWLRAQELFARHQYDY